MFVPLPKFFEPELFIAKFVVVCFRFWNCRIFFARITETPHRQTYLNSSNFSKKIKPGVPTSSYKMKCGYLATSIVKKTMSIRSPTTRSFATKSPKSTQPYRILPTQIRNAPPTAYNNRDAANSFHPSFNHTSKTLQRRVIQSLATTFKLPV